MMLITTPMINALVYPLHKPFNIFVVGGRDNDGCYAQIGGIIRPICSRIGSVGMLSTGNPEFGKKRHTILLPSFVFVVGRRSYDRSRGFFLVCWIRTAGAWRLDP